MSASKRWIENIIDKRAALMVIASGNKYDHAEMESIAQRHLEEVGFDMTEFDTNQLIGVSMEQDW